MKARFHVVFKSVILLTLMPLLITQVTATPQPQETTHYAYLPIITMPVPPLVTESRYVVTAVDTVFDRYGCKQGKAMQAGQRGVVVLFFGRPAYDENTQTYGTKLLDDNYTFTSTADIARSAELWADGFWRCTYPDGPKITLAISTSNNQLTLELAANHGIAWANMINDIGEYITYKNYNKQINIVGSSNIELGWSTPEVARAWVDSYAIAASHWLYVVGDCSGCPSATYPGRVPDNGWTMEDIWYVSWKSPKSYPLPEIYNPAGTSASQWYFVARWAFENKFSRMHFAGVVTQWQACIERNNPCEGTNNQPEQAWKQLWDTLNRDPNISQSPDWTTDIRWDY